MPSFSFFYFLLSLYNMHFQLSSLQFLKEKDNFVFIPFFAEFRLDPHQMANDSRSPSSASSRSRSRTRSRSPRRRERRRRSRSTFSRSPSPGQKRLHIGNLDESVRRRDIEDVFGKFGRISDCWMASYPPFYAFVVFENNKDASACLKDLGNTAYIKGCRARVTVALPRNGATYRRGPPPPPRRYYDEEDSSRRRRRSRSRTRSPRRSRSRTPRRSRSRSPRRSRRHRSPSPKRERKEKDREEKDIEAKEKQPESKDNVNAAKERSTGDVDKKRRTPPSSGGSSRSSSAS